MSVSHAIQSASSVATAAAAAAATTGDTSIAVLTSRLNTLRARSRDLEQAANERFYAALATTTTTTTTTTINNSSTADNTTSSAPTVAGLSPRYLVQAIDQRLRLLQRRRDTWSVRAAEMVTEATNTVANAPKPSAALVDNLQKAQARYAEEVLMVAYPAWFQSEEENKPKGNYSPATIVDNKCKDYIGRKNLIQVHAAAIDRAAAATAAHAAVRDDGSSSSASTALVAGPQAKYKSEAGHIVAEGQRSTEVQPPLARTRTGTLETETSQTHTKDTQHKLGAGNSGSSDNILPTAAPSTSDAAATATAATAASIASAATVGGVAVSAANTRFGSGLTRTWQPPSSLSFSSFPPKNVSSAAGSSQPVGEGGEGKEKQGTFVAVTAGAGRSAANEEICRSEDKDGDLEVRSSGCSSLNCSSDMSYLPESPDRSGLGLGLPTAVSSATVVATRREASEFSDEEESQETLMVSRSSSLAGDSNAALRLTQLANSYW